MLVLGIDGGGSKTVAWLAGDSAAIVGRGTAGASNFQAVGFEAALASLDRAVAAAFEDARLAPAPVAAAVVALAGCDREENRQVLIHWAEDRRLARRFRVVHDAIPVLAAGTPEGWGVALISGTGSLAFGQDRERRSARAGWWGYLFGDEGSAYAIALAGLRAAAKAADGRGPATQLVEAFLDRLRLARPEQLVAAVYRIAEDRAAIAALAEVVLATAEAGDAAAGGILDRSAEELAAMVAAVAERLSFPAGSFALALAGGMLLAGQRLRTGLASRLAALGPGPSPVTLVPEPVAGAVRLAQSEAKVR
jgi:N-acetylglucosamine kinase-like BadF-type ATPase